MVKQKFTVFLMPADEGGYQVIFPYYPNCTTDGDTLQEALDHAKEAMEGILEADVKTGGDPVPHYVYAEHVVVGTVDIEVPKELVEPLEEAAAPA